MTTQPIKSSIPSILVLTMPNLVEQAILDAAERYGPMTRDDPRWPRGGVVMSSARGSLLSRRLLLDRKRTVKCRTCKGRGERYIILSQPQPEAYSCAFCTGTGSVKELIIGLPCGTCHGNRRVQKLVRAPVTGVMCWCPDCYRDAEGNPTGFATPTPGSESEAL
jgi:hypothetical protein